jgi:predicted transposase YbfD/YdcC
MSRTEYKGRFFDFFHDMHDARQAGKVWHKLIDVLFIAVSATIANCDDWEEIALWASKNEEWLRKYLELPYGIPSTWTFERVFALIDPKQFSQRFIEWMQSITVLGKGTIIAVDGKTMRGTVDKRNGKKALHMVSAWCSSNQLILGQVRTSEKSNEITAIPELLDMLSIKGCIVTIDAMGCQKSIAEKIVDKKADYIFGLKGNQGTLRDDVEFYYMGAEKEGFKEEPIQQHRTIETGHGRIEERLYYYTTDIGWLDAKPEWAGLAGIGMVIRKCDIGGKKTEERSFYISSVQTIEEYAKGVRQHWGIESTHWSLDVTFREDACRVRKSTTSENLAMLKRLSLNMVKKDQERYPKKSLKKRRFIACMNADYVDYILRLSF